MNRESIKKTAVCRYDDEEKCFIVSSPLYPTLIGAAETEEDAWDIFHDDLDDAYTSYLEGRMEHTSKPSKPDKKRANGKDNSRDWKK
jgi:predicted RNase H-like HicB family nuclease